MTRTAATKLVATALAVASLGIAGTAQAEEAQGIAIGEPTPGQPVPGTTPTPAEPTTPAPAKTSPVPEEEEVDYTSPAYFKSQEAKDRFARYCNMKDAEPSHSDKKFCEDFRKNNGGTTTTTTTTNPGNGGINPCYYRTTPIYNKYCPKPHPKPHPTPHPKPYPTDEKPVYNKASEPSKGSLPFTGLEIWQLGLLGLVLGGGGIGVRRLLAS